MVADLPRAGVRAGGAAGVSSGSCLTAAKPCVPNTPEVLGLGSGPVGKQSRSRRPENDEGQPRREPEAVA